jgi:GDPmannose 4,6-dehydratase
MAKKRALVTGITGQDGSYLAELLLDKDYEVFGLKRRVSGNNLQRISHLLGKIELIDGDLLDSGSIGRAVEQSKPDEIYNLGAQSFVRTSFDQPEVTGEITGLGVTRILESLRGFAPKAKFYQASSSEMFGHMPPPHTEETDFYPRSPYGIAKTYGHWMTVNYRESYGLFACCGLLYNHESPRRGKEFVTQKIARAAAGIKMGIRDKLELGNLDAARDWGHARDYVEAMWRVLQHDEPGDYVVATNKSHSVREFADAAFKYVGLNYEDYVSVAERFFRPTEVNHLRGDASKIKKVLGWTPTTSFSELVEEMVQHALDHPEEWENDENE